MSEPVPTQLMGALGAWLSAHAADAEPSELDLATRLVLDLSLVGVAVDDLEAPELAGLTPSQRAVVDKARHWTLGQRAAAEQGTEPAGEQAAVAVRSRRGPAGAFSAALGTEHRSAAPSEPTSSPSAAVAPSSESTESLRPQERRLLSDGRPRLGPRRAPADAGMSATVPAAAAPAPRPARAPHSGPPSQAVPLPVGVDTDDLVDPSPTWRRYEEALWWVVCFVAVAIILWRQLV